MSTERRLPITRTLALPWSELEIRATRSGGPGGQHVNTTSTRVEVRWNALQSPSLSEPERQRILAHLGGRLSSEGQLRVVASSTRSQLQNRELALARLRELLARALAVPRARKRTRPTTASRQRRLDTKRRRGALKRERRRRPDEE